MLKPEMILGKDAGGETGRKLLLHSDTPFDFNVVNICGQMLSLFAHLWYHIFEGCGRIFGKVWRIVRKMSNSFDGESISRNKSDTKCTKIYQNATNRSILNLNDFSHSGSYYPQRRWEDGNEPCDDRKGMARSLCSAVVCSCEISLLTDELKGRLPSYMIPTLHKLDELPLNINGKCDYAKLETAYGKQQTAL